MISVIQKRIPWICQVLPCSSKAPVNSTRSLKIHRAKADVKQRSTHKKDESSTLFRPNFSKSDKIIAAYPEKLKDLSGKLDDRALQQVDEFTDLQKEVNTIFGALQSRIENDSRKIVMIGSASNSLLRKGSDIDIVLMPFADSHSNQEFRRKFSVYKESYMNAVAKLLNNSNFVRKGSLDVLRYARVPIIQFHAKNGYKVDIQFGNPDAIVSSYAIGCSLKHDLRVRALILWLSNNFSASSLKGSTHGMFSTYHICSLVIHFIRSLPLPIIPDFYSGLSRDPFESWKLTLKPVENQEDSNDVVHDSTPSSHLLVKMIDYYAQINLEDVGLNTSGGYVAKKRQCYGDEVDLYLFDPCFAKNEGGQCMVAGASTLISQHFTGLRMSLESGNLSHIV